MEKPKDCSMNYFELKKNIKVVLLTIIEMLRDGDGSGTQTINHHGQPRVLKVLLSYPDHL